MITRENYEIYSIDFLEGKLSEQDRLAFLRFLEQNPDLKEEFNQVSEFSYVALNQEVNGIFDKEKLKKTSPITIRNEDDFFIDELEGNLNEDQAKYLRLYLAEHPQKNKKRVDYQHTKLQADPSIVYPNKNELKKSLLWVYVNQFYPIGIAASVLLVWMYSYFFQSPEKQVYIARVDHQEELVLEKNQGAISPLTINSNTSAKTSTKTRPLKEKHILYAVTKHDISPEKMPPQTIKLAMALHQEIVPIDIPNFTYHKAEPVVVVIEENISIGTYLTRVFERKKQDIEEKAKDDLTWNDVFAWVGKKTGIHISQHYEIREPGLEIAMGNNIEIEKK